MEIVKWYSIVLVAIGILSNLLMFIWEKDKVKLISFIVFIPILIYLILE